MKQKFAPHTILGVHLTNRVKEAVSVQKVLTANGFHIKTRLGLHDIGPDFEGVNGLLLIETLGSDADVAAMTAQLKAIEGVDVQKMVFEHP